MTLLRSASERASPGALEKPKTAAHRREGLRLTEEEGHSAGFHRAAVSERSPSARRTSHPGQSRAEALRIRPSNPDRWTSRHSHFAEKNSSPPSPPPSRCASAPEPCSRAGSSSPKAEEKKARKSRISALRMPPPPGTASQVLCPPTTTNTGRLPPSPHPHSTSEGAIRGTFKRGPATKRTSR